MSKLRNGGDVEVCRLRKITISLIILLFSGVCYSENYYILSSGGGSGVSTLEAFYTGIQSQYQATSSFTNSENIAVQLGPTSGPYCFSRTKEEISKKMIDLKAKFLRNPTDCGVANELFMFFEGAYDDEIICSSSEKDFLDFNGDGQNEVDGSSSSVNFEQSLKEIYEKAKSGDHLYINLDDHGLKTDIQGHEDFLIGMGDDVDDLYRSELEALLDAAPEGLTIHLANQVCFGGGFVDLSKASEAGSSICSVAMSDRDTYSYGNDVLFPRTYDLVYGKNLEKYGDQLRAHTCSMVQDPLNRPNTSLDSIVRNWLTSEGIPNNYCPFFKSLENPAQQATSIFTQLLKDDSSSKIIDEFKSNILSIVDECSEYNSDDKILLEGMYNCLESEQVMLDEEAKLEDRDFFERTMGEEYGVELLNDHMIFLLKAPKDKIEEYISSYCCLSFNFKTDKAPDICGSRW